MAFTIAYWSMIIVLAVTIFGQQIIVLGQENAQTRIPNSLVECYDPVIYQRDNRLPATINTLIELIRKVEYSTDYNRDIKEIAVSLLHRFRMDGIEQCQQCNFRSNVLPFGPSGFQFSKHRLLLSRLIPGNVNSFPNHTLSTVERCALHFLLSSSIETQVRGDESTRCGQLAQFRTARMFHANEFGRKRRSAYMSRNNYLCDIEMMSELSDPKQCQRYRKQPRNRQYSLKTTTQQPYESSDYGILGEGEGGEGGDDDLDGEPEEYPYDNNAGRSLVDVASNAVSQCPVENGVMRTTWGAVAAGPLIAGIAAGLVQQNVATMELLKLTRNYNLNRRQPLQANGNGNFNRWGGNGNRPPIQLSVDNRWAATLAGDLAEVTLLQGPMGREMSVGAAGAWNSTTVPHWYFLSQRERLEMTDAEIRGGIDGLAIGVNVADWRRDISQLRLSQLLDMYYSNHGILSTKFRSCNRRELFNEYAQPQQLQAQGIAFSTVLDREMQLRYTLTSKNIEQFSSASAETLVNYISNGLNDVTCDATSAMNSEIRARADLHIFIETTWQFNEIQPAIATLLENVDVNRFDSQVTLYNANDAATMVNTSSTLLDFYMLWNQTSHSHQPSGFNLAAVIKKVREIGAQILDEERARSQSSGRSFIALVVPQLSGVSEGDSNFVAEQLVGIRERNPDLKLLFWSGGSHGRFARYVQDQNRDIFPLLGFSSSGDSSQQINAYTLPVIKRIKEVPRRISNPRCNAEWQQNDWGQNNFDQFVEQSGVNFYRLSPNYFQHSGGTVRVQGRQQAQIIVCTSRNVELPRFSNTSQQVDGVNCRQLMNSESYDYGLAGACDGYSLIQNCPPVYISVQSAPTSVPSYNQCNDLGCRFPNDIKFNINIDNLGCYSSSTKFVCESIALVFSLALVCLQKVGLI